MSSPQPFKGSALSGQAGRPRSLWTWLPVLSLFRGFVLTFLFAFSLVLLRRLGLYAATITSFVGWLMLPYVLKPLVRPWIRRLGSSRLFLFEMEVLIVLSVAGIGFSLQQTDWKHSCMVFYAALALWGALHDIVADNFCSAVLGASRMRMVARAHLFAFFLTLLAGLGVLVMIGGNMEVLSRTVRPSWVRVCYIAAGVCLVLLVAQLILLPRRCREAEVADFPVKSVFDRFVDKCAVLAKNPKGWPWVLFLLFYLLPLSLLWPMSTLFLIDPRSSGGMGLSPQEVAYVQGTVGVLALLAGCLVGEMILRRQLLSVKTRLLLVLAFTLPVCGWMWLSFSHPSGLSSVVWVTVFQSLGAGLGFTPYRDCVYPPPGSHRVLSPQAARALMTLSVMVPFTASGSLYAAVGYRRYFFLVLLSCGVSIVVAFLLFMAHLRYGRTHS